MTVKVVNEVKHEIILGMDFARIWNVEVKLSL